MSILDQNISNDQVVDGWFKSHLAGASPSFTGLKSTKPEPISYEDWVKARTFLMRSKPRIFDGFEISCLYEVNLDVKDGVIYSYIKRVDDGPLLDPPRPAVRIAFSAFDDNAIPEGYRFGGDFEYMTVYTDRKTLIFNGVPALKLLNVIGANLETVVINGSFIEDLNILTCKSAHIFTQASKLIHNLCICSPQVETCVVENPDTIVRIELKPYYYE